MKIKFVGGPDIAPEITERNIAASKSLGLPEIGEAERPVLAVIGGGPSVAEHIEELKNWKGDIWSSGSAYPWTIANGINATFLTIDQCPTLAQDGKGAKKAILATCCDPSVFEMLKDAEIEVFDLQHEGEDANHGPTSVSAVPKIALLMGYKEIHFFGCDSSYAKQTHAYHDWPVQYRMIVECNGDTFETGAGMLMQAEFMSVLMRQCPDVFVNRSGGLLKALVEAPSILDYDITHGSPDLCEKLRGQNNDDRPDVSP